MSTPLIIAISGASGSGKSLFTKNLLKEFSEKGKSVQILREDHYYRAQDNLSMTERERVKSREVEEGTARLNRSDVVTEEEKDSVRAAMREKKRSMRKKKKERPSGRLSTARSPGSVGPGRAAAARGRRRGRSRTRSRPR